MKLHPIGQCVIATERVRLPPLPFLDPARGHWMHHDRARPMRTAIQTLGSGQRGIGFRIVRIP